MSVISSASFHDHSLNLHIFWTDHKVSHLIRLLYFSLSQTLDISDIDCSWPTLSVSFLDVIRTRTRLNY
jgi:hypothetical protein